MILKMSVLILVLTLFFMAKSENTDEVEIENALKALLTPQQNPSIQHQALQRELLRKLQQALKDFEEDREINYKPPLNSLLLWDNIPNKRNLEALARAGLIRTLPETDEQKEEDDNEKRSIANLAKNGQLPNYQINESKREIESLASNTKFYNQKEIEKMLDNFYNKRNIQNLARNFNFPSYGKRSLSSLIRNGDVQYSGNKNIQSSAQESGRFLGKRNLASFKAQFSKQTKKDYGGDNFEYLSPVYQYQNDEDRENLQAYNNFPLEEKRFLGSVARSGWFRPSPSVEKRHIGALARLGWLPTLRNTRRFNRSYRSPSDDSCREASTNG